MWFGLDYWVAPVMIVSGLPEGLLVVFWCMGRMCIYEDSGRWCLRWGRNLLLQMNLGL